MATPSTARISEPIERQPVNSSQPVNSNTPVIYNGPEKYKHFIRDEKGNLFAGRHVIIELWDIAGGLLRDPKLIEDTMIAAAQECGATLLKSNFHHFDPDGVTGVVMLAESHMSIHTWPECNYAAIDVFMCGEARPTDSMRVFNRVFEPGRSEISELKRGMVLNHG